MLYANSPRGTLIFHHPGTECGVISSVSAGLPRDFVRSRRARTRPLVAVQKRWALASLAIFFRSELASKFWEINPLASEVRRSAATGRTKCARCFLYIRFVYLFKSYITTVVNKINSRNRRLIRYRQIREFKLQFPILW